MANGGRFISGATSFSTTGLDGVIGEDISLADRLPVTSGNSWSDGEDTDGDEDASFASISVTSCSAHEMALDRRFEVD